MDDLMKCGILLSFRENSKESFKWSDIEVLRKFNWGQIHNTWSPIVVNTEIETFLKSMDIYLNQLTEKPQEKIYQMDLDYSCSLHMKKDLIVGEC